MPKSILVINTVHSNTSHNQGWLFNHGAFVMGVMFLSEVLFSAFIPPLELNCLEVMHLHLLSLWNAGLCLVRVFPLMAVQVQSWRDVGSSSSCETLVCAARPSEDKSHAPPHPP